MPETTFYTLKSNKRLIIPANSAHLYIGGTNLAQYGQTW